MSTPNTMNINELGKEAHVINAGNGWDVFSANCWPDALNDANNRRDKVRFLCTHMALVHSEVSEALEAIRKDDWANFDEELADTLIRVLDLTAGLGIDIDAVVAAKLAKNRTRGFRHGGKRV